MTRKTTAAAAPETVDGAIDALARWFAGICLDGISPAEARAMLLEEIPELRRLAASSAAAGGVRVPSRRPGVTAPAERPGG